MRCCKGQTDGCTGPTQSFGASFRCAGTSLTANERRRSVLGILGLPWLWRKLQKRRFQRKRW